MTVAATELLRRAIQHFGTQAKLSEAMSLGPNGGSQVSRWAAGTHALSYENTMSLLEACGWLNLENQPSSEQAGQRGKVSPDPLEEVGRALRALEGGQKRMIRLLEGQAAPKVRRSR